MIPVFQDMSVVNDGCGNCFNACVASILELPLREVAPIHPRLPEFDDGIPKRQATVLRLKANQNWHDEWDAWLAERGLELVTHPPSSPPKGYSIASGRSSRTYPVWHQKEGQRIHHSVVAFDGVPVHDPFPIKGEFDGITHFQTLEPQP